MGLVEPELHSAQSDLFSELIAGNVTWVQRKRISLTGDKLWHLIKTVMMMLMDSYYSDFSYNFYSIMGAIFIFQYVGNAYTYR